jgi:DNA polymerase III delta prime subunit
MKHIDTVLLFSNPFGYGPTTTLLHIAEELSKRTNIKLVAAGKDEGLCKEIFRPSEHPEIEWRNVDERNFDKVKTFISQYPNSAVVSILNRFCIQAASELRVPNALVDFLAWFWEKPANEYRLADLYFINSLGEQVPQINTHTFDIPIILGPIPQRKKTEEKIVLINIGGSQNPLVEGIPTNYLTLFSEIINRLHFGKATVFIAGGKTAADFVKVRVQDTTYKIGSLPHEQFLKIHAQAHRFISLSGTNATFMSFALGVPSIFLFPQLLAHWKLSLILERSKIPTVLMWEHFYPIDDKTYHLSEKDLVPFTETLSAQTLTKPQIMTKIVSRIQNWIDTPFSTSNQNKFIKKIGSVRGEEAMISTLIKQWGIPEK